jgi:hypothetical protein
MTARSVPNLPLLAVLGAALVQSGWRSLYAVVVLAGSLAAQVAAHRRRRRAAGERIARG